MNSNYELRKSPRDSVYLVRKYFENTIQYNYGRLRFLEKWVTEDRSGTVWHSGFNDELEKLVKVEQLLDTLQD
ncbi:hypothetical protein VPMG_00041 [Vibrio phage VBP32]|uniref:Uncharacterized protein n=2 Tax=Stoningtonvirus VBP47 TaxID=2846606 RepID=M4SQQ9_9CAUD|nr:hypothetical protein VPNG_00087 [Vibrio phage VBP47]YP_007676531.1 hypothetical protein VPMG_00041 [Vibrio phage VBP32]AGH57111.1 hypothetical protein VPNG_00087 [Vibrio phage VBP47]AGH57180.1 hypothetical protein VPMG_00041 [Vibrio phage VBP32]